MDSVKNWTKEEFKAYMLIYASESDHTVTEAELELLEEKFDSRILKKMSSELKADNDYQRLQKVSAYIQNNDCTQDELDVLLNEMKEIFMSDGNFDVMEQATFRFMKKMLKA
jgi:transcriptional regulator of heat shock response